MWISELGSISIPVLIIFGDSEVCVEYRKVVERAESCIGQLQVHIVAGAGHALHGEKPDIVNALIVGHVLEQNAPKCCCPGPPVGP